MASDGLEGLRFENGVLRRADGSIDIAAYGRIAHGERLAALHAAFGDLFKAVRGIAHASGYAVASKQTLSGKAC